jgi:hypothetical protein
MEAGSLGSLTRQRRHPPHFHGVQSPSWVVSPNPQKTDYPILKHPSASFSKRYRSPPYCIPDAIYHPSSNPNSSPNSNSKNSLSGQPTAICPDSDEVEPGEVLLSFGPFDKIDSSEPTSHHPHSFEFGPQRLPITQKIRSVYEKVPPKSPASIIYHHIQKYISDLSPLKHVSIHELKPLEYPFSVYEPRGPRASLFWTLWSSLNPNARPVDIYHIATQHGARVSHRVKVSKLREIFPHKCLETGPIPPYVRNPNYREYLLTDSDPQYLNQNYLHAVKNLLSREKARGFIERGGLAWRLAIEFGASDIWTDVFNGPSLSVCRFSDGEFVFDEGDWICEQLLAREKELLVGAVYETSTDDTVAKSLFPPIEVFESSMHWNGVWSRENETWFKAQVTRLQEHQLRPKSRYLWGRWARSHVKYITDEDAALWNDEAKKLLK